MRSSKISCDPGAQAIGRRCARLLTYKLFTRAAKTEFLADIDELNAPVNAGRRMRRIAQLLLTHTDRFKHTRIDVEWIDQGIADRFCTPLTQADIVLTAADRIGVADNKEAIAKQDGIVQRIGDGADRPILRRFDDC